MSALDRAIEYLDAVEVAPAKACEHIASCVDPQDCGMVNRFAYQHEGAWFVASRAAVCSLAAIRHDEPQGGWNAVSAKRMPSWWSPEQRLAYIANDDDRILGTHAHRCDYAAGDVRQVTVDLETGKEAAV